MGKGIQLLGIIVLILGFFLSPAFSAETLKIATLTDMSGPYAELAGWGNINAAKMAIEDFGGKVLGMDIEYVYRDHQCKADLANQKAIELYEKEKADVIFDSPNSAAGLAVSNQALLHKKLYFAVTSGTTRYTGDLCNRYTFHWAYNDYVLAT
ncbi:MAG: ABC transporter substrate-binding protein, partial [Thermodesulfobacteriota bacterium]